ncbi:MAG: YqeG family HAD IIIA-type phosphatase [Cyanobacteria bacterium SIG30]|nr:YqeG family HAD IIIA-type phosphatase [Cyanobacteria bacterium SIG30]
MSIKNKIKAYLPLLKGKIKPDYNLKNIYEINIDELWDRGIRAIFFDLDSTITVSKSAKFSDRAREFIKKLEDKGFKLAIISNNYSENYISRVQKEIHIKIYFPAEKPQTFMLKRVMDEFSLNTQECAMVGDRPVTDILAGINAGCLTILVDGIDADNENLPTRFIRWVERLTVKN